MEILSASQIRQADQFTIDHTPISSVDLMERAARKCFDWFNNNVSKDHFVHIVCGPGNNGGDGLALARMLFLEGYNLKVSILHLKKQLSSDCQVNMDRLKTLKKVDIEDLNADSNPIIFEERSILVDAIFGTGFSGKTEGLAATTIRQMNDSNLPIISIDMPSGVSSDKTSLKAGNEIIKPNTTLTFQYLKIAMMMAENASYFGRIEVLDIGLLRQALENMSIQNFITDSEVLSTIYEPKREFSHKGTFGHTLLITGGEGKMGAAILAARSFLKSGGGLLTVYVPTAGVPIIQEAVPEAMALHYSETKRDLPDFETYKAIGVGPGIGTGLVPTAILDQVLNIKNKHLVLDADALNIISMHPEWLTRLPEGSILTPHPGEFKRLAGTWNNDFEKLEKQRELAQAHKIYLILKGKFTSIACPDGTMWFNPTGNPGMAKGGSGDILTGLLTGLISSGYSAFETCILGTWLHGMAGDLAAELLTQEAMNASDIIDQIPQAWKKLISLKINPI